MLRPASAAPATDGAANAERPAAVPGSEAQANRQMGSADNVSIPNRLRLVQTSFGHCRWRPVKAVGDDELAAHGVALASCGYDLTGLDDGDRVRLWQAFDSGAREALRQWLPRVPRCGWCPPIDLDVREDADAYVRAPDGARLAVLEAARALAEYAPVVGLGVPMAGRTNAKGSTHLDIAPPSGFAHVELHRAAGWLVRRLVERLRRETELPLPTSADLPWHRGGKGGARRIDLERCAAWNVDISLFKHKPSSRGRMWRLPGSWKPGGTPKQPLDLATGELRPLESWQEPVPGDLAAWLEAVDAVDREQRQVTQRAVRRVKRAVCRQVRVETADGSPASLDAVAALADSMRALDGETLPSTSLEVAAVDVPACLLRPSQRTERFARQGAHAHGARHAELVAAASDLAALVQRNAITEADAIDHLRRGAEHCSRTISAEEIENAWEWAMAEPRLPGALFEVERSPSSRRERRKARVAAAFAKGGGA